MPSSFPPSGLWLRMSKYHEQRHQRKTISTSEHVHAEASTPHNEQPRGNSRMSRLGRVLTVSRRKPKSFPSTPLDLAEERNPTASSPSHFRAPFADSENESLPPPPVYEELPSNLGDRTDDDNDDYLRAEPNLQCHLLTLPNELLHEILQRVRAKYSFGGFQKFLFVCKRFYIIGMPLLYTEVFYSSRTYHDYLLKLLTNNIGQRRIPGADDPDRLWKTIGLPPRLLSYHAFAAHTTSFTLTLDWQLCAEAPDRIPCLGGHTISRFFLDTPQLVAAMRKLRQFSLLVIPQAANTESPTDLLSRSFRTGILGIISAIPDSLESLNVDIAAVDIGAHLEATTSGRRMIAPPPPMLLPMHLAPLPAPPLPGPWNLHAHAPAPPPLSMTSEPECGIPLCIKLRSLKTRLRALQILCAHSCADLDAIGHQMQRYRHWKRGVPNSCPCTFGRYRKVDLGKYTEVCLNWYECEEDRLLSK